MEEIQEIIYDWDVGAGDGGGWKIDGVQQRESVHPRGKRGGGGGLPEAISDGLGRVSVGQGSGTEERWVHVPCLLGPDLTRPHRPRRSRPPLWDPLSGCLGWSCPRGTIFKYIYNLILFFFWSFASIWFLISLDQIVVGIELKL